MTDTFKVQFEREKTALKFFLLGRGYVRPMKALGFVERYHTGLRKDGLTPELHHQVQIALSIIQLRDVANEELALTAALLHDVQEDAQIQTHVIEHEFGADTAAVVWKLTKKFAGDHKSKEDYLTALAEDETASLVKGVDRCNNLASMQKVFTSEKQLSYAHEAKTLFLPMLKRAAKLFPHQQHAYHAISQQMKLLIKFTQNEVGQAADLKKEIAELQDKIRDLQGDLYSVNLELSRSQAQNEVQNSSKTDLIRGCLDRDKLAKILTDLRLAKDPKTLLNDAVWFREKMDVLGLSSLDFLSKETVKAATGPIPG